MTLNAGLAESVNRTVNRDVPAWLGVPEITPVDPCSDSPAGKLPEVRAHVYGEMPPVAESVTEYRSPTVASGSVEGEMTSLTTFSE